MTEPREDGAFLRRAARLGARGHGGAEPNPMVGCLIVAPGGRIVGEGHHRRCGGPHAEIVALERAGARARGATAYVTLEPCNHQGRTGPCTEALVRAGVGRVVFAQRDPGTAGSAERLAGAGIETALVPCPAAAALSAPFRHHLETGRPWVLAKWAQTLDGRVATRRGDSRWISGPRARALVHRERGRVDAIVTGIGTVRADDPLLTARGVRRRRTAVRVVIDPGLEIGIASRLVRTAREVPLTVLCAEPASQGERAGALRGHGVDVAGVPADPGVGQELSLQPALRFLAERHGVRRVLVEAGPGLLGRLFGQGLVNEAWVFVAPLLFGDEQAVPAARGLRVDALTDGVAMELAGVHRRGEDVLLRYLVG